MMLFLQEKLEFAFKAKLMPHKSIFLMNVLENLVKKSSCFARKTKLYPLYITVIHRHLNKDLDEQV